VTAEWGYHQAPKSLTLKRDRTLPWSPRYRGNTNQNSSLIGAACIRSSHPDQRRCDSHQDCAFSRRVLRAEARTQVSLEEPDLACSRSPFPFSWSSLYPHDRRQCPRGTNAVFSMKREGYRKTYFDVRDSLETTTYPGFWRLAARKWREGPHEMWRSFNKAAFTKSLQRLIPEVNADDLIPSVTGVRAQALLPT
jgi:hypothetical protein